VALREQRHGILTSTWPHTARASSASAASAGDADGRRGPSDGRASVLQRLRHHHSKTIRMERVSEARKAKHAQEPPSYHRDRVARRWELELAQESFARYFPSRSGNPWDSEALLEALADFGIKARTRPAKLQLTQVLAQREDSRSVGFGEFCGLIEEAREKLRSCLTSSAFHAWKRVDLAEIGALSKDQLFQLLGHFSFTPQTAEDKDFLVMMVDELNQDNAGLYSFHEAEHFLSWARERAEVQRRSREREIREQRGLGVAAFNEFRSQLIEFHDAFVEADEDDSGLLNREEALELLSEFGCLQGSERARKRTEEVLAKSLETEDEGELTFPNILFLVRMVRRLEIEARSDDVRALFVTYDTDRSGELDLKEICNILLDLNLQPKSPQEQIGIAELIEEVDVDGSGQLNYEEVTNLAQRIAERLTQLQRATENRRAESLGFSRKTACQLRHAFEALDSSGLGYLGASEAEHAVQLMGWRVSNARFTKLVDDANHDDSRRLDFMEFLWMMRHVEDEMISAGLHHPDGHRSSDGPGDGSPAAAAGAGAASGPGVGTSALDKSRESLMAEDPTLCGADVGAPPPRRRGGILNTSTMKKKAAAALRLTGGLAAAPGLVF